MALVITSLADLREYIAIRKEMNEKDKARTDKRQGTAALGDGMWTRGALFAFEESVRAVDALIAQESVRRDLSESMQVVAGEAYVWKTDPNTVKRIFCILTKASQPWEPWESFVLMRCVHYGSMDVYTFPLSYFTKKNFERDHRVWPDAGYPEVSPGK